MARGGGRGLALLGAGDHFGRLPECANGVDGELLHDGGLGDVVGGDDQPRALRLSGGEGDGQHTGDGTHGAVEGELAHGQELVHVVAGDLLGGGEDGEGDGEVEGGSLFADVRGGEVDGDAMGGKGEVGVADGRPDALARLLDGEVGKPDDGEARQAGTDVHLRLDQVRVYSENRAAIYPGEHRRTLLHPGACFLCAAAVGFVVR